MATAGRVGQLHLLGRKIRDLRKQHKLTPAELAGRLGIQPADLLRMEQDEYRVGLDTLIRILVVFQMTLGEFFAATAETPAESSDGRLISDFNALPPAAQQAVEDFIAFKRRQGLSASSARD